MTLFGEVSGDVAVGVGVNVGLAAGEGVLPGDCVPFGGTVAVPFVATVVACTGGCKIVQTKRLVESRITIPSTARNGISLLFAKTCSRGTGGCGISGRFCSGGLLTCCANVRVNSPSFNFDISLFKPFYQYRFAHE